MKAIALPIALAFLAACGSSAVPVGSGSAAVVTGDLCALELTQAGCAADRAGCSWYPNTRPCVAGKPCPAGWCSASPSAPPGGGGGGSARAACACPNQPSDVCVMQTGGGAIATPPPIACLGLLPGCAGIDPCACLVSPPVGVCGPSDVVASLCVCDAGIR